MRATIGWDSESLLKIAFKIVVRQKNKTAGWRRISNNRSAGDGPSRPSGHNDTTPVSDGLRYSEMERW